MPQGKNLSKSVERHLTQSKSESKKKKKESVLSVQSVGEKDV